MNAFKESELCMKNVLFWDTFCSCSSKNEGMGGDQLLQFLLNRLPHYSFIFYATLTLCISKEHIFHAIFEFYKIIQVLAWKNEKNRISSIDVLYTGALCTKTLNANSDI